MWHHGLLFMILGTHPVEFRVPGLKCECVCAMKHCFARSVEIYKQNKLGLKWDIKASDKFTMFLAYDFLNDIDIVKFKGKCRVNRVKLIQQTRKRRRKA